MLANGGYLEKGVNKSSIILCPSNLETSLPLRQDCGWNYGTYGYNYFFANTTNWLKWQSPLTPGNHFLISEKPGMTPGSDTSSLLILKNLQEIFPGTISGTGYPSVSANAGISYAHNRCANFMFLDGHVELLNRSAVPNAPAGTKSVLSPPNSGFLFPW